MGVAGLKGDSGLPRRSAPRSDGREGLGRKGTGSAFGVGAVHIVLLIQRGAFNEP
jgi:hypothetical protein